MVLLFLKIFVYISHARTFVCRKKCIGFDIIQNGIDPNNNSSIERFSHLDMPIKNTYLTGITVFIPTHGFFDTIVDVD